MPSVPTPSNSGIVTDNTGERHIPESTRPDGSVRKAIKIRPGYKPAEDAVLYKNRTAETFRNRNKGGVIGAEAATSTSTTPDNATSSAPASSSSLAAANKNAKRREARKKAAAAEKKPEEKKEEQEEAAAVDPEAELHKKARNLTKKLKQARELQDKKDGGQALLPEQIAKVIKMNELIRELSALGFDTEGKPMKEGEGTTEEVSKDKAKENVTPAAPAAAPV